MNEFKDCYARLDGTRLIIGNAGIERIWDLQEGAPAAISIRDKQRGREWVWAAPYKDAFRRSALPLAGAPRVELQAGESDEGGAAEPHLLVRAALTYPAAELTWTQRIWPALPVICAQYTLRQTAPALAAEVEPYFDNGTGGLHIVMVDDRLDFFGLAPLHLAYTAAKFTARSDYNDNLVQEKRAYTYNKERIRESGHYLHCRDRDRAGGLLALKISPPPNEQLNYPGFDFAYCGKTLAIAGSGITDEEIRSGKSFDAYASAVGVTDGAEDSGVELFYQLDRRRHAPAPARNFNILANNWGAGSGSKNICEALILKEIDTAAALGLTHVQLDAGWQEGIRHGWLNVEDAIPKSPYAISPDYWRIHPERFPRGFQPLAERAREKGVRLGFWFAPDASNDYANWEKDRDTVLALARDYGFDAVKIDGVAIKSKTGERNFLAFLDGVFQGANRKICINYDITGGRARRTGHFYGTAATGNLFIENRYGLDKTYFPYRTMRNLWWLSKYVPSYRLHMECVDPGNRRENYGDDPFRPEVFGAAYCCAGVLFSNPLYWMETHRLAPRDRKTLAALIHAYRPHQAALLAGRVYPIGEEPSGRAWTGFQSVTGPQTGYLIFFRELTDRPQAQFALRGAAPGAKLRMESIAGALRVKTLKVDRAGQVRVALPKPASFGLVKYELTGP